MRPLLVLVRMLPLPVLVLVLPLPAMVPVLMLVCVHVSGVHSSSTPGYFTHISITTPTVSALKNYYR
jgi:hypothetical protein